MKSLGVENKKLKKDSSKLKTLRNEHASDKLKLRDTVKTIKSLKINNEQIVVLQKAVSVGKKLINKLRNTNQDLAQQLKEERLKSRMAISKVMSDAESMMTDAVSMMKEARKKENKIEQAEKVSVREERLWSAQTAAKGKLTKAFSVSVAPVYI